MSLPSEPDASLADEIPPGAVSAPLRDRAPAHLRTACPYLAAEGRAWRGAAAEREHRCTAVGPPAMLTLEKQRRLCLAAEHATCATFLAAAGHTTPGTIGGGPSRTHVTRWSITRTTPLVLDRSRLPAAVSALSPFKRGGQVTLGGLMVVAFVAVLGGSLSGPDDRPAGALDVSPTPPASASSTPVRTPSPRPTSSPSASPSPAPTPSPTSSPTVAPSPVTYAVKSGDTLSAIARRFGTTVAAIVALNNITDPGRLRVGQVLQIPAPAAP